MAYLLAASPGSDGSLKGDLSLGFPDEEQDNTIVKTAVGKEVDLPPDPVRGEGRWIGLPLPVAPKSHK